MLAADTALAPCALEVRAFLADVIVGDIHLAAIRPDVKRCFGRSFAADLDPATEWAIARNVSGENVYWTANVCDARSGSKPKKEHIVAARFAHVDIDPPKDGAPFDKAGTIRALEVLDLPPSVIVDSGNGLQALWRLDQDTDDLGRVEAINRAIAQRFDGDSGHNIDKLLRVPGTVNYPNATKRKRGCVAVEARLVGHNPERRYRLDELEEAFPLQAISKERPRVTVEVPDELDLFASSDLARGDAAKLTVMIDHPEKYFRSQDRSAWAYGIACQMVDDRYSDAEIIGVLLNPDNVGCAHIGDQNDPMRAAKRAISRARSRYIPESGSIFPSEDVQGSNKPTIRFEGGELPAVVDQAEQALISAGCGYYQMGGRIVRAGVIRCQQLGNGRTEQWRAFEVSEVGLVEAFTEVANWLKPAKNCDVKINCPLLVAQAYLARKGSWNLPTLSGIIDTPTLRPDGSILSTPGYDTSTGLLFKPNGTEVPPIPRSPTKEDALVALELLQSPINGFPFVTDADRSVALSALLTSVCRAALQTVPLHATSAPTAGSGKTTLIDLASILRTGRVAATVAQGRTTEELEKRLGAMLLEGQSFVAIDNCESALGGEFLCQAITQPTLTVRPLGKSTTVEVPTTAMITATGNNLTFLGDMTRRAIISQLDPGVERPELRKFDCDPVKVALEQRGQLVCAALTILRGYIAAGRPFQVSPLGSFADWSNTVRSALIWLGCADPCDTMEKVRKADPQTALIKQVMAQWVSIIGSDRVTTSDLSRIAEETRDQPNGFSVKKYKHPEFREALLAVAGQGTTINGRRLGRWLSAQQGRIINGCRLVSPSTRGGQLVWVLERASAPPSRAPAAGG